MASMRARLRDAWARVRSIETADGRELYPVDHAEREAIKKGHNPPDYEAKRDGRWVAVDENGRPS